MTSDPRVDQLCVNTIRALAIDTVLKANSGHPGLPLGAAPIGYSLFARTMRHSPKNPAWPDRDRFVLSAGHGSALLYSLLHLTGYDLPLDELEAIPAVGQPDARPPGARRHRRRRDHDRPARPGLRRTPSAWRSPSATSPRASTGRATTIVDHRTFVLAGDGDLMEGVANEAASLAGHLGLGKLICFYDSNHICLAASTNLVFTTDVGEVFEGYGWHVADASATATTSRRSRPRPTRPSRWPTGRRS